MSVTPDFSLFLLVCPDACSKSEGPTLSCILHPYVCQGEGPGFP